MGTEKKVRPIYIDGKFLFVDEKDIFISTERYDYAFCLGDCWEVAQNGARGVVDKFGKQIIPCKYDLIFLGDEDSSFIRVYGNQKYGAYSKDGRMILPCRYDELNETKHGYFSFVKNKKSGIVDTANHEFYEGTSEYNTALLYEARIHRQKLLARRAMELAYTKKELEDALTNGYKKTNDLRTERAEMIKKGEIPPVTDPDLDELKEKAKISIDTF